MKNRPFIGALVALFALVAMAHAAPDFYTSSQMMNKAFDHNAFGVMTHEHFQLHKGKHFRAVDYDGDTDTGASKYWLLYTTETSRTIHLTYGADSSLNGTLYVYEAAVVIATGTAISPLNNLRSSTITSSTHFSYDPTFSSSGTLVDVHVIGTDSVTPAGRMGGEGERDDELILAPNRKYLFVYTSLSDNNRAALRLHWYEEEE